MKGYTSQQEIENYLLTTIDESFEEQIEGWIGQVENFIDRLTGRNFIADEETSEKIYDGDGEKTLLIDDCMEITSIKINDEDNLLDESGESDEVFLYPANNTPKTKIKYLGYFQRGNQNIAVEARWGFSDDVPEDIKFAATVLTSGIIQAAGPKTDSDIQSMTIGRYSVSYKNKAQITDYERAMAILDQYKKYTF